MATLGKCEKALGSAHNGLGSAASALRHRTRKGDGSQLKLLRYPGEATSFWRHLTDMGVDNFEASVDSLLAHITPPGGGAALVGGSGALLGAIGCPMPRVASLDPHDGKS